MALPRLACLVFVASAAGALEYLAPITAEPPVADGVIAPGEYARAVGFDGFAWEGRLDRRAARAWIAATATHLYCAIRSRLPDEGELLAVVDRDAERIVFDDSVELWIDPTPGSERGAAYQLLANPLGRRWFAKHARGGEPGEPGWIADWPATGTQHDGWWDWECTVPLASIAPGRGAGDGVWGINLCRNWKQPWAFSSLTGGAYAPTEMRFRFAADAPAIRHAQELAPGEAPYLSVLTIASPVPLRVSQRLKRDNMPDVLAEEDLAAGTALVPLRLEQVGPTNHFALQIRVTAGEAVCYERAISWDRVPADWRWTTATPRQPPIDLRFAYYPYTDRLRLLADVSGLPPGARLDRLDFTLRHQGGDTVVTVPPMAAVGNQRTADVTLPPLDGEYELAVKAAGEGVPAGEVVQPLVRTRYAWEHNPAGREPRAWPPFEPLRAEGRRLHAVLREHELNGLGLWDQVTATSAQTGIGRAMLAAPMRLVVYTAAGRQTVAPAEPRLEAEGEARVRIHGGFTAGPLEAEVRAVCEVDGAMQYALTLAPCAEPIAELTLEVPLFDESAPPMHAMSEGIRDVICTQRVPAGQGVVWTSRELPGGDLPRGSATYCFVGGPVRGLAWYAENDRGWSRDPNKPNLELVREPGALTMRIHLIDQPVRIDTPRTIAFGLQAAPVKPRLSPWRWRWFRDGYSLLGTDINWFALGDCGSVYPAHRDLYLWEMLRRGNREQLPEAEVEAVVERGRPYFEPYGPDKVASWAAHVRHNLRGRLGAKMVFYYNRASFQLAEEFQTFENEWGLSDYRTVGPGNGIGEIKIVPSESYIDHALWWYAKSFEVGGNQGVYWDNWFIVPSHNTVMTDAYSRPDGAIMPAAGIAGLRELSRRTFNMMCERGMTPITMPHMTSTNILPLHGFATVQYDWEWKYSEGDVQSRFPREYLLLVSNGELAGTWPVLLGEHGRLEDDEWTQRTFAAVSIVHELDPPAARWRAAWKTVWQPLLEPILALLDEPDLEVYRYWDERQQPVRTGDPDLPAIVYAVPGREAVVAVASYRDEDATADLVIDAAALGLAGELQVTDVETRAPLPVEAGRVRLPIRRHDIRELRITAAGGAR